ncbi:uncharacterized protein LOC142352166 isoform X2 [Convolutriloba macropyga]
MSLDHYTEYIETPYKLLSDDEHRSKSRKHRDRSPDHKPRDPNKHKRPHDSKHSKHSKEHKHAKDRHPRHRNPNIEEPNVEAPVEPNPKKVYRTLYIIGVITAALSFIMISIGYSDRLATCQFGHVDLTPEVLNSIFQNGDGKGYVTDKEEVVALELNFGLWRYCVGGECKPVKNPDENAEKGEINKMFEHVSEVQAAQAMMLISQLILTALFTYLIVASVKVITLRLPILILNSTYLFFLLVGCALSSDWLLRNVDMYDGFCQIGTSFMMP